MSTLESERSVASFSVVPMEDTQKDCLSRDEVSPSNPLAMRRSWLLRHTSFVLHNMFYNALQEFSCDLSVPITHLILSQRSISIPVLFRFCRVVLHPGRNWSSLSSFTSLRHSNVYTPMILKSYSVTLKVSGKGLGILSSINCRHSIYQQISICITNSEWWVLPRNFCILASTLRLLYHDFYIMT